MPVFAELLDTDDPERIREAAWAFRRASTTHLRLYAGVRELLKRLRETDARVILLSNAQALFTRPELALLGDASALPEAPSWLTVIPLQRDLSVGFFAGTDAAEKWIGLLENRLEGRWKHDRAIFERVYC